jgi:hypothetical protein
MARLPGVEACCVREWGGSTEHSRLQRTSARCCTVSTLLLTMAALPTQCSHALYNAPRPLSKSNNCPTAESVELERDAAQRTAVVTLELDAGDGLLGRREERAQVEGGSSRRKEPTMKQHVHARPHQFEAICIARYRTLRGSCPHASSLHLRQTPTESAVPAKLRRLSNATSERSRRAAIST